MEHIGIITTNKGWGGSEELWYVLVLDGLNKGYKIDLYLDYKNGITSKISEINNDRLRIFSRPRIPSLWNRIKNKVAKLFNVAKPQNVYDHFFAQNFDVLLISMGHTGQITYDDQLMKQVRNLSIPYYILSHYHHEYFPMVDYEMVLNAKDVFEKAKKIFFVSQRNLKTAERQFAIRFDNSMVVKNPVNLSDISEVPYSEFNNSFRFACVGRLDVMFKGQDILIEVLSQDNWRDRNWSLTLYGVDAGSLKYLQDLVKIKNIGSKVIFAYEKDIRKIWGQNQILIMPSIGEGTALSMVEAMLCGRTMVLTDVGGASEWVEDGITGFIAEAPSVKYLSKALEKAWERRFEWKELGQKARASALTKFDPDAGSNLLDLILN